MHSCTRNTCNITIIDKKPIQRSYFFQKLRNYIDMLHLFDFFRSRRVLHESEKRNQIETRYSIKTSEAQLFGTSIALDTTLSKR
jgi:hypothetical protein